MDGSGITKYEVIEKEIRARIADGIYTHKLPGEKVLAKEFEVSFPTVRKAMVPLVKDGLIERISGKGSFVKRKQELTDMIGVVMAAATGPVQSVLLREIEEAAARRGLNILFKATGNDPRSEDEIYRSFTYPGKIDGIIYWGSALAPLATGLPCVSVLEREEESSEPHSTVVTDDYLGAKIAVSHLLQLGHKNIGIVLPVENDTLYKRRRLEGYAACMRDASLVPREPIGLAGNWERAHLIQPIRDAGALLEKMEGVTALFCYNDVVAAEVVKYLNRHGHSVPKDMSVVGYDDMEFSWALDITSVKQPFVEIGRKAIDLLIEQIHNEYAPPVQMSFPPELIVRKSSAAPALYGSDDVT